MKKYSFNGFTLVEMLVVTVIIMLLFGALITILNPKKQRDAVYDAQRVRNLEEIRGALDTYYNDFNLYPTPGAFPFNAQWQINNVVYMAKVPQDPSYPSQGYVYQANPANPQWVVLYTKLGASNGSCPLTQITPTPPVTQCTPTNYASSWSCIVLGVADCAYISGQTLP